MVLRTTISGALLVRAGLALALGLAGAFPAAPAAAGPATLAQAASTGLVRQRTTTTYYVAPNGSDSNPGTKAAPFASLQAAHDAAAAGDTIYLRGGVYAVSDTQLLSQSGAPGNPIKVFNYPGETPILDGSAIQDHPGGDGKWILTLDWYASWWHIKGLELRNNPRGGGIVGRGSSNVLIEQNHVHGNGFLADWEASGIAFYYDVAQTVILNNDVHHNADSDYGDGDGIQIAYSSGPGNLIQGNRSWRNSDDGIDLWDSANVTLKSNWSFGNGLDESLRPLGNGVGFKLGGAGAGDGGHTLIGNVAWQNANNGFDYNSGDLPNALYHNTAWDNGVIFGYEYEFHGAHNVFRNNLAYGALGETSGSASFNSWTLPVTLSSADFQTLDDTCALGPRAADGSLPECGFLHLVPGSDLIDKGTDLGFPFAGAAPDLGAFESGR